MELLSKQELIGTITKQVDQIKRYENRIRDIVAAYKGLAKEKEALEISLNALNNAENQNQDGDQDKDSKDSVAALAQSLSMVSMEKSRLEEAFQADKKATRDKYESIIASMKEEHKSSLSQHQTEISNLKAKISYEIQQRENERADNIAIIKELNMKLNSERQNKEKLEDKVTNVDETLSNQAELEKRVRELTAELEACQRRLRRAEARAEDTPQLLLRLQQKMALLERSHSVALREEQIKAKRGEESARRQCAAQEERVAELEARVAELSRTVAEYDARNARHTSTIRRLQDALNGRTAGGTSAADTSEPKSETDNEKLANSEYMRTLIDKMHIIKKELLLENERLGHPIDVSNLFQSTEFTDVHIKCKQDYSILKAEFEAYKDESERLLRDDAEKGILERQIDSLKLELADRTKLLEAAKQDKIDSVKFYEEKLRIDAEYNKETISELKTRVQGLEKQVKTQRDRYAALLEETDSYIRAKNDRSRKVSADNSWREGRAFSEVSTGPHMLHYAHELARKDLDITQLRKEKHILEEQFRDCQREATIDKERFKEVIRTLKNEIDRLRRIQSREGANLEYLKNVVLAYLTCAESAGRTHMLNAIAAVLHFTPGERDAAFANL